MQAVSAATHLIVQGCVVLPDALHLQSMHLTCRLACIPVRRLRRRHLLLVPQPGILQPLIIALLGLQDSHDGCQLTRCRAWT
jgi:hypothetical protein